MTKNKKKSPKKNKNLILDEELEYWEYEETKLKSYYDNCNPEIFENCVIMALNNVLPFMCRKKQDKRKFIESIFNLEVFSKMLVMVRLI